MLWNYVLWSPPNAGQPLSPLLPDLNASICCDYIELSISSKELVSIPKKTRECGKEVEWPFLCLPGNPCLCICGRICSEACFYLNIVLVIRLYGGRNRDLCQVETTNIFEKNLMIDND